MDKKEYRTNYKNCNACMYCNVDELGDLICVNGDSEYCADYVEKDHTCCDFVSRKVGD